MSLSKIVEMHHLTTAMRIALCAFCWLNIADAGDIVGKVVAGYQGWLSAVGDGSSVNQWKHTNLECWPDVREYTNTFTGCPFKQAGVTQPAYNGNLGNGSPAGIYSAWSDQTVNKHFEWMQHYGGIDCVALQRFGSELGNTQLKDWKNGIAAKVRSAAETYGRKYYIMYDISGWTNFQSEIKTDWTALKVNHLASAAYAMEGGKPVVCVWGMGFSGRPGNAQSWKDVLDWFKAQGCYVIGGVSQGFQNDSGSYTDPTTLAVTTNQAAYKVCDMVMVWTVGKTSGFSTLYADGLSWCNTNGKAYQADIYPGTAFYNTNFATDPTATKNKRPRTHGDFMWSQFAAARSQNVHNIYISMFDELQEATQIFKTAEDASMIPDGKYFLTLDADGVGCSSDFYLRLTKDGSDMIKGIAPYVTAHPTEHILGGTPALDNLVLNPSFETGGTTPTSWTRGGSAVGSSTSTQEGTNSLRIATTGTNSPTTQTIPIQIGKTYNISVWINASGMTSGNAVFDTSDKYDGTGQGQFVMRSANSGWTKYSGSFTATTTSVTLRMFTESAFAGTVYFDNIVLTEQPPANSPPIATAQDVTTAEDTARPITLNGSDVDGDPLTFAIGTPPAHGTLAGTAPNVTYTPDDNYVGTDSFTFTVNDGTANSLAAMVSIEVTAVMTLTVWLPAGSGLWTTAANWSGGVAPMSQSQSLKVQFYIDGTQEAILDTVATVGMLIIGDNGTFNGNRLRLTQGADLTSGINASGVINWTAVGYNRPATMTVESGAVFRTAGVLYVGFHGTGSMTPRPSFLNIAGGAVMVRGNLALGTLGTGHEESGGYVTVDGGGILQVGGTLQINKTAIGGSRLNIRNGVVLLDGNQTAAVIEYIAAGTLVAYDGSRVLNVDYNISNPGKTTISVAPITFSSWIGGFFQGSLDPAVIGFQADPDGDGLANGLEFVLDGNPALNDTDRIMPGCTMDGDNTFFTYKRSDASKAGIPQIVQYGDDLSVWTDVTIGTTGNSSGSATYTVAEGTPVTDPDTIAVTIPRGGADRLFVRLKVIQPPN